MDIKFPLEGVFLQNYIKYTTLKKMNAVFKNSTATQVNIYIDLYSMLLGAYRENTVIENYSIMTSSIINLCAHLRSYYDQVHSVNTKIFIVYSDGTFEIPKKLLFGYNQKNDNKIMAMSVLNNVILNNLPLLDMLCKYLKDIYFIRTNVEPMVAVYDLILKEEVLGNTFPNIILSKDPLMIQVPAMHGNSYIFKNKKTKEEEIGKVIYFRNAIPEYIISTRNSYSEALTNKIEGLDSKLLSLIIALTNLPSRNINSLLSINRAISIVSNCAKHNIIINGYNSSIDTLYKEIILSNKINIDKSTFENRFKAIDLIYQQMVYMNSPLSQDDSWRVNLNDPNGVREINNKYFIKNPLDLNRL